MLVSNPNINRLATAATTLRLVPFPPIPEKHLERFPELREWNDQIQEVHKRNEQEIGRQIALAQTRA